MAKKYPKNEVIDGVLNFLKESPHEGILSEVALELSDIVQKSDGVKTAVISSVYKLEEEQIKQIKEKIEKSVGYEISLREIVSKKLIGGFKIKLGDWVYDNTLKGQLDYLKNELSSYV